MCVLTPSGRTTWSALSSLHDVFLYVQYDVHYSLGGYPHDYGNEETKGHVRDASQGWHERRQLRHQHRRHHCAPEEVAEDLFISDHGRGLQSDGPEVRRVA